MPVGELPSIVVTYLQRMQVLVRARADADDGVLSQDEESRHMSDLDAIWTRMSVVEQEQVERQLHGGSK